MRISTLIPLAAAVPPALSARQQPPFTNTTTLPTHFAMLLFPHFQALDVFGPLDVLNTLSMLYSNQTSMTLTLLSRTMDPVGTNIKGMHGAGNFGEQVLPTSTFAHVLGKTKTPPESAAKAHAGEQYSYGPPGHDEWGNGHARRHEGHDPDTTPPSAPATNHSTPMSDIEVLLVPGGGGTRQNMTEEIAFVKEIYPKLKYIISICTGATLLSRAGILNHRRATTNKRAWAWATTVAGTNTTDWVPNARWVSDGNVFTSSGISAGIDVTLAWVGHVYGEPVADYLADSMEILPSKSKTSTIPAQTRFLSVY
ncbi:hypothetical protein E8E13_001954 [Curvularia kusanoi]|uniref:DJ-1/PfpI domain-containing protein n=1 Tax=Curvularia kusanoi TaxID=90978 RepID=A0A9P4T566_CURKU|nr:hypothetical protein E8E13_001954 [Curvularia kusanoi]